MANEIIVRNNFFIYGETGERLSGIRDSMLIKISWQYLTSWNIRKEVKL